MNMYVEITYTPRYTLISVAKGWQHDTVEQVRHCKNQRSIYWPTRPDVERRSMTVTNALDGAYAKRLWAWEFATVLLLWNWRFREEPGSRLGPGTAAATMRR